MKLKLSAAIVTAGLMALSLLASESSYPPTPTAPDKEKLSYAVGMRMGMQLLEAGTNVDINIAVRAVQDVLDGKPTMLQPSDLAPILNQARQHVTDKDKAEFSYAGGMRAALLFKNSGVAVDSKTVVEGIEDVVQGKAKMKESEIIPLFIQAARYAQARTQRTDETDGAAFLAANAKKPGVKVLRDGLQYEIIKQGAGPYASPTNLIYIAFSGTFINGVQFDHHPHFLTRINGGIQGWKDVLPKMRVGSEWKIFVPPNLAFGKTGESFHGIGPDTTVEYDLKLLSIAPPGGVYEVSSGLGHGLDIGVTVPDPNDAK